MKTKFKEVSPAIKIGETAFWYPTSKKGRPLWEHSYYGAEVKVLGVETETSGEKWYMVDLDGLQFPVREKDLMGNIFEQ